MRTPYGGIGSVAPFVLPFAAETGEGGWRWWRARCKVPLGGSCVAGLSPNPYSVLDVSPGMQKFCGAIMISKYAIAPTWRSLRSLHAEAGKNYYIECSPGLDDSGASEPTLSEPAPAKGRRRFLNHSESHSS